MKKITYSETELFALKNTETIDNNEITAMVRQLAANRPSASAISRMRLIGKQLPPNVSFPRRRNTMPSKGKGALESYKVWQNGEVTRLYPYIGYGGVHLVELNYGYSFPHIYPQSFQPPLRCTVIPEGAKVIRVSADEKIPPGAVYIGSELAQPTYPFWKTGHYMELSSSFKIPSIPQNGYKKELKRKGKENSNGCNLVPKKDRNSQPLSLDSSLPDLVDKSPISVPKVKYVYDPNKVNKDNPYSATGFFPQPKEC